MNVDGYIGTLYGPEAGSGRKVSVFPRGGGLECRGDESDVVVLPYAGTEVSVTGLDDKYLLFTHEADVGTVKLMVADKEIVSHVESLGAPGFFLEKLRGGVAEKKKRKRGRGIALGLVAAFLLGCVLVLWHAFSWAIDELAQQIPLEWEQELGRSTAAEVLSTSQVCTDPGLNQAVGELGSRLVMGLGATPYKWRIRVLDSQEVNAFALPGGYIFVNRGLLEKAQDGHEVAGVLAHEIQHVIKRHGIKNVVRQIGVMVVVWAVVGDSGQVEQFVAGNAAGLASMSFSRDQEREADKGGLELIYRSGLEPTGLMRFMSVLSQEEGLAGAVPTFLSTHPASEDRAEELSRLIREWGIPAQAPLASDWSKVKGVCAPATLTDPDGL